MTAALRLRILPRFPARIEGADGVKVTRPPNSPDLTVSLDIGTLGEMQGIPNPAQNYFAMWNAETGSHVRIPFQSMFDGSGVSAGFPTRAAAELATILPTIHAIEVYGGDVVGDGLGGLHIDADNGSSDTFISGDGRIWYRAADVGTDRLIDQSITEAKISDALATKVNGAMQKATYDPQGKEADAFPYDTEDDFLAATIPLTVLIVTTNGYYAAGDGGGHRKVRVAAPSPVEPWHKQSADGAWWMPAKQVLSSRMLGAKFDDATDDINAINGALRLSALFGVIVEDPAGTARVGETIVFPNGAHWKGNAYKTIIKKLPTHTGAMLKTENFDALTGTSDAFAPTVPERVSIDGITFNGNYQNSARTVYVQTSGEGLRIFARKVKLKARVFNMQGAGVWVECPEGNGPAPLQPGFSREAEIVLYTHQTQYEGVIWKGPPDVKLDWILQADAGSRIVADQFDGKVNSPNYGPVNGGKCDGVVFDGHGAEIEIIHAFGNLGGGGIDWRNGGRINANLLMVESCHFGGISISGSASGMISKLDVHRTGGFDGDTTADFVYAGTGGNNKGVDIGICSLYRQGAANVGTRNALEVTGDFLNVSLLKIDLGSTATAGHGLFVDADNAQWITIGSGEIARCKGIAPDGLPSSGVYRKATGNGSMISVDCTVRDCDVGFRSAGAPLLENIDLLCYHNAGQSIFIGDARSHDGQDWNVRGTVSGLWKGSTANVSVTFDSTLTTEQTVSVPHNLIAPPIYPRVQATLVDTPTSITTATSPIYFVSDYDATNITVKYKQATATGANTTPRVFVRAEV